MKQKNIFSLQEWLPFKNILDRGIIELKNNSYIKIIKVIPINFNLKSNLEKEAILNSYKIFLKTCNFNLQLLVQSNKEDLSYHISNVSENIKKDDELELINISKQYIDYIKDINKNKYSSSKNFYIIIKILKNKNINVENNLEEFIVQELNENYFKIKDCLSRCGNLCLEIENKEVLKEILYSFLNVKNYFKKF